MLKADKMAKCKDLSNIDKGQTVMAGPLGQNIPKTTDLEKCNAGYDREVS